LFEIVIKGDFDMPSSHVSANFHIVFSTKDRLPLIRDEWQNRLLGYLGGIVKGLNAIPISINGVEDHVHLLVALGSTHRLDYFLRDLKADSSEWVHKELARKFEWQKGYGAFSVSPSAIPAVKRYISKQKVHHHKKTFQEEYIELLIAGGLDFDERYLW
jgi:REP element-mobilizing transposase RayT